jgi:hypothetical protein
VINWLQGGDMRKENMPPDRVHYLVNTLKHVDRILGQLKKHNQQVYDPKDTTTAIYHRTIRSNLKQLEGFYKKEGSGYENQLRLIDHVTSLFSSIEQGTQPGLSQHKNNPATTRTRIENRSIVLKRALSSPVPPSSNTYLSSVVGGICNPSPSIYNRGRLSPIDKSSWDNNSCPSQSRWDSKTWPPKSEQFDDQTPPKLDIKPLKRSIRLPGLAEENDSSPPKAMSPPISTIDEALRASEEVVRVAEQNLLVAKENLRIANANAGIARANMLNRELEIMLSTELSNGENLIRHPEQRSLHY